MAQRLRFGPYLVDGEERALFRHGQLVALSPKVLETLELLASAQGRIVSKAEFMQALWPATFVEEGNLSQNIFVLRRALGVTETGEPYIQTVPRRGYRFAVPVEVLHDQPSTTSPDPLATPNLPPAPSPTTTPTPGPDASASPHTADTTTAPASPAQPNPAPSSPAQPNPAEPEPALPTPAELHPVPPRTPPRWQWPVLLAAAVVLLALAVLSRTPANRLQEVGARRLTNDGVPKNLGAFPPAMVSDGKRLRFTERRDNRSYLADVALEGGPVHVEPAPFQGAVLADYSPRTATTLIGSVWRTAEKEPLLIRDPTGSIRPLGDLRGHDGSFSPDGTHLAWTRGNSLFVANADGSAARPVATGKGLVFWPRWSPDGKSLRFSENYGANETRMWQVPVGGGIPRQVLAADTNRGHVCCGSWTANGRWFFYLVVAPNSSSIWALPAHRSWWQREPKPVQVVPSHDMAWQAPVPGADGTRLWAIGSDARAELLRVNPSTRALEPYLGGLSAEGVSFSPDRQWIAYTAFPEQTLWVARVDGEGRRQLTHRPVVARFPRWSPDGRTIAFLAGEPGSNWRLFLADVASGTTRPLLPDGTSQGVASWSPDGQTILFGHLPNYGSVSNAELRLETFNLQHGSLQAVPGSESLWTPRWSPDGRYIAAVTVDNRRVRLYDTERRTWSDLANLGANDMVWTPDSRYLFFDTVLGTPPLLYRVRIADGTLEQWADLRGLDRGGLYGSWLGLSADSNPILLRDRTIEEVYEITMDELH